MSSIAGVFTVGAIFLTVGVGLLFGSGAAGILALVWGCLCIAAAVFLAV